MYRYTGTGLPNVFLKNGYQLHETPYGEGVSIHDIDGLHKAIGEMVVLSQKPLTGHEFRFLRTELDLSQAGLGGVLGCDEQTIARFEKGKNKKISAPAERLLRVLYSKALLGEKELAPVLRNLQEIESTPPAPTKLVASEGRGRKSWKLQAVAC